MDSPLVLCFDTFTLGHTPILSCWHWLVRMYTGSPFRLEMFWHQSLSMLYMQPSFFIQQSASKGLGSNSWIFVNSIGVHTGTHPICCLVHLFRQLGLQNLFQSFLSRHLHIRCAHWGIPYISFVDIGCYGMKWMIFFSRMSDCDVFSSLTLTACAVMRF